LVRMHNHTATRGTRWKLPKILRIDIPHDSTIPLLHIYPKDVRSIWKRHAYIHMFPAALFTTANTGNQTKFPSRDKWIMIYGIYSGWNTIQYHNRSSFIFNNMDCWYTVLIETYQSQKELSDILTHMQNLKQLHSQNRQWNNVLEKPGHGENKRLC
jgi:hypothetical protein